MQSAWVELPGSHAEAAVEIPTKSIALGHLAIRSGVGDLDELKDSISRFGLLSPILVRRVGPSSFEVVAGNRRLKAVLELGLPTIQARVLEANDRECYEIFLAENLQRQTLDPLDEARAFYRYVSSKAKHGLGYGSVSELASRIGKSQEYVSNRIGLLRLRESTLRQLLDERRLPVSHVEELASISDNPQAVSELSDLLASQRISVRVLEKAVQLIRSGIDTSRALELAKIESGMRLGPEDPDSGSDQLDEFMRRTKKILEAALSYLDNTLPELEKEPSVYKYWVENVRLPVHRAIDGTIVCQRILTHAASAETEPQVGRVRSRTSRHVNGKGANRRRRLGSS